MSALPHTGGLVPLFYSSVSPPEDYGRCEVRSPRHELSILAAEAQRGPVHRSQPGLTLLGSFIVQSEVLGKVAKD